MTLRIEHRHSASSKKGWIGVDFDGTLSTGERPWPEMGTPVPAMMERVRAWLAAGVEVRIVTVRAGDGPEQIEQVQDWLAANGLPRLQVTDRKAFGMFQLWDDRAVRVERDTGQVLGPEPEVHRAIVEHKP
jgi:hypothetical protein